jgi:hypothetical protein
MTQKPEGRSQPAEVVFDVTDPSGPVEFLGLLKGLDGCASELTGLFRWRCASCGMPGQDVAVIRPQQAFLARWLCESCSSMIVVQYRARSSAEWITAHSVAITGKALGHLADDEACGHGSGGHDEPPRRRHQTLLAGIAIPALIGLIFLALSDWQRVKSASASHDRDRCAQPALGAFTQLSGYWASDDGSHTIYFRHVNSDSLIGMYMRTTRRGDFIRDVRFQIDQEASEGQQLVLQELHSEADGAGAGSGVGQLLSGATIYVPKSGESIMRVEMTDGRPVTTAYHQVASHPAP